MTQLRPLFVPSLFATLATSVLAIAPGDPRAPGEKQPAATPEQLGELFEAAIAPFDREVAAARAAELRAAGASEEELREACPELRARKAAKGLAGHLQRDLSGWETVRPLALARYAGSGACDESRRRVLDLVSGIPCCCAAATGEQLFALAPEAFDTRHLLALAESGSPLMTKQLVARAGESVLVAAFLAWRGGDAGRTKLEEGIAAELGERGALLRQALATGALRALDTKRLDESGTTLDQGCFLVPLLERAHAAALAALDAGELERARSIALEMGYCAGAFARPWLRLSEVEQQLAAYCAAKGPGLSGPDEVFAELERLLRAG